MKNNLFHKTTPLQPYIAIFSGSESASIGSPSPIELLHLARNGELNLRWYACTKENVARLEKMYSFTPFSTLELYMNLKSGEKRVIPNTLFFSRMLKTVGLPARTSCLVISVVLAINVKVHPLRPLVLLHVV